MLMLKQTLATRNYDRPLNLEGPINFPPFPELVFGANEAQRIELSFDIDLGGDRRIFGLSEEAVRLSVSVTTAFDTAKQEMYREKVTGTIRGRENQMLNGWTEESLPGKPRRLTLRTAKRRSLNISMSESSRRPQSMLAGFFQLPLELLGPASRRQRIRDFLSESGIYGVDFSISAAFGESLSYIGPLRESPHRYYEAAGETPLDVGQQGERAVYILRGSAGRDRNSLLSHVRRWLVALGIAADVQVEEIAASLHRITVVDPHTGVVVNIADIGFGASQVLPIIVQGYFQEPDSVLLLEQPEIHLHARSQGVLADMFLDISKHLSLIVETHSQHMVTRIQRRVADGTVSPEDIAIYYFEPSAKGTQVSRILLSDDGSFAKGTVPPKLFMELYDDTSRMLSGKASR